MQNTTTYNIKQDKVRKKLKGWNSWFGIITLMVYFLLAVALLK